MIITSSLSKFSSVLRGALYGQKQAVTISDGVRREAYFTYYLSAVETWTHAVTPDTNGLISFFSSPS